jgi:YNFM family putative membrane transporter
MGLYLCSLVAGGMIGRIGVALLTDAVGWRWAIGGLAVLPLAGSVILRRHLVDLPSPARGGGISRQLTNPRVLRATVVGSAFFFTFVGTFSFVVYRLEAPPFGYGTVTGSLVFCLWLLGASTPVVGRLVDRVGWRRMAGAAVLVSVSGTLLTLPDHIGAVLPGLALFALGNFSGVTAAQIGIARSTDVDRGAATAVYFSCYYALGALGAYLPGVAWQTWGWGGVVSLTLGAFAVASAALVVGRLSPMALR